MHALTVENVLTVGVDLLETAGKIASKQLLEKNKGNLEINHPVLASFFWKAVQMTSPLSVFF